MVLNLDLSASRAKVARAKENYKLLDDEIRTAWKKDGPYDIRFSDVDKETGWCDVTLVPKPQDPRFGVLAGDVVHELRSALNYVITALVDASEVELTTNHIYPIFIDRAIYADRVGSNVAAKDGGPLHKVIYGLGLIEQTQPYHREPDPRADPLWLVHRFDNADKHRQIAGLLSIPADRAGLTLHFKGHVVETQIIPSVEINWALDAEVVIHRMRFDPPVATDFRAEGPIKIIVGFTVPPFGNEPIHSVYREGLDAACDYVETLLEQFATL